MATKKYEMQPVLLLPRHIKWLSKESKKLTKEWDRYVSMSELIRFLIDANYNNGPKADVR
jgi:hypothetical protein